MTGTFRSCWGERMSRWGHLPGNRQCIGTAFYAFWAAVCNNSLQWYLLMHTKGECIQAQSWVMWHAVWPTKFTKTAGSIVKHKSTPRRQQCACKVVHGAYFTTAPDEELVLHVSSQPYCFGNVAHPFFPQCPYWRVKYKGQCNCLPKLVIHMPNILLIGAHPTNIQTSTLLGFHWCTTQAPLGHACCVCTGPGLHMG